MNLLKRFISSHLFYVVIILLAFGYLFGYTLFSPGAITYNDAAFYFADNPTRFLSTLSLNYFLSENGNSVFLYVYQALSTWVLHGVFNVSFEITSKILTFGVLLGTLIHLYFTLYAISRDKTVSLGLTLIFLTINQTIEYIQFGGFYYHFVSLNGLFIALRFLYYEFNKQNNTTINILAISLGTIFINHPFYLVIFGLYYGANILFLSKKYGFKLIFVLPIISSFIFNLYWLLPFVLSSNITSQEFYTNTGKNIYAGFKTIATASKVFFTDTYFAQSSYNTRILKFGTTLLTGLIIAIGFGYKNTVLKNSYFAKVQVSIGVIFLTLAILPSLPILGNIFEWGITHISFLGFFRSITRFSVIYLLIYLIILSLKSKQNPILKKFIILAGLIMLILTSSFNLNKTINTTPIPREYISLNSYLHQQDKGNSVLILPSTPYDVFKWSNNSNQPGFKQIYLFYDYFIQSPIITDRASLKLFNLNNSNFALLGQSAVTIQSTNSFNKSLANSAIGYILFDKSKIDFNNSSIPESIQVERFLESNPKLHKVIDNEYFTLYNFTDKNFVAKPTYNPTQGIIYNAYRTNTDDFLVFTPYSNYYTWQADGKNVDSCRVVNAHDNSFRISFDNNCLNQMGIKDNPVEVKYFSRLDKYIVPGLLFGGIYLLGLLLLYILYIKAPIGRTTSRNNPVIS